MFILLYVFLKNLTFCFALIDNSRRYKTKLISLRSMDGTNKKIGLCNFEQRQKDDFCSFRYLHSAASLICKP
jgi:hypothetical protein